MQNPAPTAPRYMITSNDMCLGAACALLIDHNEPVDSDWRFLRYGLASQDDVQLVAEEAEELGQLYTDREKAISAMWQIRRIARKRFGVSGSTVGVYQIGS